MSDYRGKICPFCKTVLGQDDDIVVCSDCDMPHHKECWIQNRCCTTFGCVGTIKSADTAENTVTAKTMIYEEKIDQALGDVIFCTRCGRKNASVSSFCTGCGNKLRWEGISPNSAGTSLGNSGVSYTGAQTNYTQGRGGTPKIQRNATVDPRVIELVGSNADYYLSQFQDLKSRDIANSWNWAAFLLSPFWLIYRKMYAYGAALLGIGLMMTMIADGALSFLMLGGYVASGIFGNFIYLKFLEEKSVQANAMHEPYRSQYIMKHRDVDLTAAILTGVGYGILVMLLSA